jgi:glutathione reductase (NADPH)
LVIIGGGSGGSGCSKRAAEYGASVCIIERGVTFENGIRQGAGVGGTCVNVGCVPKKLMWLAAAHREAFHGSSSTAAGYGFSVSDLKFDWAALVEKRNAEVKRLNGVYEGGWKKKGITLMNGFASFVDSKTVSVKGHDATETIVQGTHIVIAVGGYPAFPRDTPGAEEYGITSDGFFDLKEQPKKCAVIGAGYIAVEMAGILQALGTDTNLMCRGDTVMRRGFDPFIVETLMTELKAHGPTLTTGATVQKVELAADGTKTLTLKDGRVFEGFDTVLFAIGRAPATKNLGLETIGVETNRKGQIVVDQFENTTVANIYALGDVTQTGFELTPVAIAAGRRLADRLFGGCPDARIPYECIPTVVFSHPPIGTIGMTQQAAEEHYGAENIRVKQSRFKCMIYSFNSAENKVKSALKLVLAGPEEKVVGLHMIGPNSDEMMQGFGVAVRMGATRSDFEATMAIHPTIGEEMVTFMGWGQDSKGKPLLPPSLRKPEEKVAPSPSPASAPAPAPALAPEKAASCPVQSASSTSWVGVAVAFVAGAALSALYLKKVR